MQINNRVILHALYILFAFGLEIYLGALLSHAIGGLLTALILLLLTAGLAVVYAMVFWGWRYHKDNKVADFFADILTYLIDAVRA